MKTAKRAICIVSTLLILFSSQVFAQNGGQDGGSGAAHARAMQALDTGDFRTAYAAFSQMAQSGDPDGYFHLGVMHEKGEGVRANMREAYAKYYIASKGGHRTATEYARDLERAFPATESASIRRSIDSKRAGGPKGRRSAPRGQRPAPQADPNQRGDNRARSNPYQYEQR